MPLYTGLPCVSSPFSLSLSLTPPLVSLARVRLAHSSRISDLPTSNWATFSITLGYISAKRQPKPRVSRAPMLTDALTLLPIGRVPATVPFRNSRSRYDHSRSLAITNFAYEQSLAYSTLDVRRTRSIFYSLS